MKIVRLAALDAARRVKSGHATLVCAYDAEVSFAKFPLDGAIPLAELRATEHELERDGELIFYCRCPDDKTSLARAQEYALRGFSNVFVLAGGVDAWRAAGLRERAR